MRQLFPRGFSRVIDLERLRYVAGAISAFWLPIQSLRNEAVRDVAVRSTTPSVPESRDLLERTMMVDLNRLNRLGECVEEAMDAIVDEWLMRIPCLTCGKSLGGDPRHAASTHDFYMIVKDGWRLAFVRIHHVHGNCDECLDLAHASISRGLHKT